MIFLEGYIIGMFFYFKFLNFKELVKKNGIEQKS